MDEDMDIDIHSGVGTGQLLAMLAQEVQDLPFVPEDRRIATLSELKNLVSSIRREFPTTSVALDRAKPGSALEKTIQLIEITNVLVKVGKHEMELKSSSRDTDHASLIPPEAIVALQDRARILAAELKLYEISLSDHDSAMDDSETNGNADDQNLAASVVEEPSPTPEEQGAIQISPSSPDPSDHEQEQKTGPKPLVRRTVTIKVPRGKQSGGV